MPRVPLVETHAVGSMEMPTGMGPGGGAFRQPPVMPTARPSSELYAGTGKR
jgi:hypothetical protein